MKFYPISRTWLHDDGTQVDPQPDPPSDETKQFEQPDPPPDEPKPFQPGDVVQLKSGGPLMTVIELVQFKDISLVNCGWFIGSGEFKAGQFRLATIKAAESKAKLTHWTEMR